MLTKWYPPSDVLSIVPSLPETIPSSKLKKATEVRSVFTIDDVLASKTSPRSSPSIGRGMPDMSGMD